MSVTMDTKTTEFAVKAKLPEQALKWFVDTMDWKLQCGNPCLRKTQ